MALDLAGLATTAGLAGPGSSHLDASALRLSAARKRSGGQLAELLAMLGGRGGGGGLTMPAAGGGGRPIAATALGGNVEKWITDSMRATGLSEKYRGILRTLVQHESSGRADAVNNWDSNARSGHPTKGIGQARDDTFAAHRLRGFQGATPGEGQIFDPEENLVAVIRYALGRYHDLNNLPGVRSMRAGGGWKGY